MTHQYDSSRHGIEYVHGGSIPFLYFPPAFSQHSKDPFDGGAARAFLLPRSGVLSRVGIQALLYVTIAIDADPNAFNACALFSCTS